MSTSIDFSKKSIVFITGASKGIGQAIAVELSRRLHQNSVFILLSRSIAGLNETRAQIQEINKSLIVHTYSIDFYKPDIEEYRTLFQNILGIIDTSSIQFGIIFHNAGHVGILKHTTELTDLATWREYYDLNLFSVSLLNSLFIKSIRPVAPQLLVVNITSLCGREPFEDMAMYCSGKAARELFFKVLAVEEPKVIVLNYSPGPVDTDMFNSIIETAQSEQVKKTFKGLKTTILTACQTVNRMLDILEKGDFKSGTNVDYYD